MLVSTLSISVSDRVAAERWYAGLYDVLLSHHLCGFSITYVVLGAQLGFFVPRHLHMTSRVSSRNPGRHIDIETGKVVTERKFEKHGADITMRNIIKDSKAHSWTNPSLHFWDWM